MRVIVFCPTIHSAANPIYESLKYLDEDDIILDYSDYKLLEKLDEIEKGKVEIQEYKEYLTVWKKYMKIDEDMSLLSHDELLILSKYDFRDPKDVPHPPYKYLRFRLCRWQRITPPSIKWEF